MDKKKGQNLPKPDSPKEGFKSMTGESHMESKSESIPKWNRSILTKIDNTTSNIDENLVDLEASIDKHFNFLNSKIESNKVDIIDNFYSKFDSFTSSFNEFNKKITSVISINREISPKFDDLKSYIKDEFKVTRDLILKTSNDSIGNKSDVFDFGKSLPDEMERLNKNIENLGSSGSGSARTSTTAFTSQNMSGILDNIKNTLLGAGGVALAGTFAYDVFNSANGKKLRDSISDYTRTESGKLFNDIAGDIGNKSGSGISGALDFIAPLGAAVKQDVGRFASDSTSGDSRYFNSGSMSVASRMLPKFMKSWPLLNKIPLFRNLFMAFDALGGWSDASNISGSVNPSTGEKVGSALSSVGSGVMMGTISPRHLYNFGYNTAHPIDVIKENSPKMVRDIMTPSSAQVNARKYVDIQKNLNKSSNERLSLENNTTEARIRYYEKFLLVNKNNKALTPEDIVISPEDRANYNEYMRGTDYSNPSEVHSKILGFVDYQIHTLNRKRDENYRAKRENEIKLDRLKKQERNADSDKDYKNKKMAWDSVSTWFGTNVSSGLLPLNDIKNSFSDISFNFNPVNNKPRIDISDREALKRDELALNYIKTSNHQEILNFLEKIIHLGSSTSNEYFPLVAAVYKSAQNIITNSGRTLSKNEINKIRISEYIRLKPIYQNRINSNKLRAFANSGSSFNIPQWLPFGGTTVALSGSYVDEKDKHLKDELNRRVNIDLDNYRRTHKGLEATKAQTDYFRAYEYKALRQSKSSSLSGSSGNRSVTLGVIEGMFHQILDILQRKQNAPNVNISQNGKTVVIKNQNANPPTSSGAGRPK